MQRHMHDVRLLRLNFTMKCVLSSMICGRHWNWILTYPTFATDYTNWNLKRKDKSRQKPMGTTKKKKGKKAKKNLKKSRNKKDTKKSKRTLRKETNRKCMRKWMLRVTRRQTGKLTMSP
eukprot:PhF_6_TR39685/c0_g1_i1/m.58983